MDPHLVSTPAPRRAPSPSRDRSPSSPAHPQSLAAATRHVERSCKRQRTAAAALAHKAEALAEWENAIHAWQQRARAVTTGPAVTLVVGGVPFATSLAAIDAIPADSVLGCIVASAPGPDCDPTPTVIHIDYNPEAFPLLLAYLRGRSQALQRAKTLALSGGTGHRSAATLFAAIMGAWAGATLRGLPAAVLRQACHDAAFFCLDELAALLLREVQRGALAHLFVGGPRAQAPSPPRERAPGSWFGGWSTGRESNEQQHQWHRNSATAAGGPPRLLEPHFVAPHAAVAQAPPGGRTMVLALAVDAATNAFLFTGGSDNAITVWSLPVLQRRMSFLAHTNYVTALEHTAAHEPVLVSASRDGRICLWDASPRRLVDAEATRLPLIRRIYGHTAFVQATALLRGRLLATGCSGGVVRVWDLAACLAESDGCEQESRGRRRRKGRCSALLEGRRLLAAREEMQEQLGEPGLPVAADLPRSAVYGCDDDNSRSMAPQPLSQDEPEGESSSGGEIDADDDDDDNARANPAWALDEGGSFDALSGDGEHAARRPLPPGALVASIDLPGPADVAYRGLRSEGGAGGGGTSVRCLVASPLLSLLFAASGCTITAISVATFAVVARWHLPSQSPIRCLSAMPIAANTMPILDPHSGGACPQDAAARCVLAVGSWDGAATLVDVAPGSADLLIIGTLFPSQSKSASGPPDWVSAVQWLPSGLLIVAAGSNIGVIDGLASNGGAADGSNLRTRPSEADPSGEADPVAWAPIALGAVEHLGTSMHSDVIRVVAAIPSEADVGAIILVTGGYDGLVTATRLYSSVVE